MGHRKFVLVLPQKPGFCVTLPSCGRERVAVTQSIPALVNSRQGVFFFVDNCISFILNPFSEGHLDAERGSFVND